MFTTRRRRPILLGLLLLTATVSGCGGGSSASQDTGSVAASGPATAQTVHVDGTGKLTFAPSTITAKVGELTIELGIKDGTPHNLEFTEGDRARIPLVTGAPQKASYTFTKAGTYGFVCTIHPGMAGKVVIS